MKFILILISILIFCEYYMSKKIRIKKINVFLQKRKILFYYFYKKENKKISYDKDSIDYYPGDYEEEISDDVLDINTRQFKKIEGKNQLYNLYTNE